MLMLKFKEIMATLFAVFGVFALIGATGAVETDQWVLALALVVMGTCTMFLSIICQEK
jgi:fatty acid desaturase